MLYTPNDMARAGCTTLRGIRHWESEGLFGEVSRTNGGTRQYSLEQFNRAKIIAAASFGGWKLDEIKAMLIEWGPEVYEALCSRLQMQMQAAIRLIEELPAPPSASTAMEFDL